MKVFFYIFLIAAAITFSGCTSMPAEKEGQEKFSYKKYESEFQLQTRDGYELGIALSGGGLRSSLFSYGVLKAFYDLGILEKADIISSVSGGGYTAYALFTSNDENDFGDTLFRSDNYLEETCKLITTGNFVTVGSMIRAGFSLNPKSEAIELYHRSIGRTYGKSDQGDRLAKIGDFLQPTIQGKKPFWVINTTVDNPSSSGWSNGLFEFTPLWMGNDSFGYRYLKDTEDFELRRAIAISGAAFAPLLKQDVSVSLPNYSGNSVTLSDGGHSENLGVVALIKRGVKNIVVIDAEHDPNYSFGGYINLKQRLKAFDSNLNIKEIEVAIEEKRRLKRGLYIGEVTTLYEEGEGTSNIYYLKMGMPESLDEILLDKDINEEGEIFHAKYIETLNKNKGLNGDWNCSAVRNISIDFKAWYAYNVSSYSGYLNYESYVKNADLIPGDFFTSKFPQYTTVDQSFYLDQALAFIGLGYWEAQEFVGNENIQSLKKALQKVGQ